MLPRVEPTFISLWGLQSYTCCSIVSQIIQRTTLAMARLCLLTLLQFGRWPFYLHYLRGCPQVDGCEYVLSSSRWMRSKCRWHIDSYPPALQTWEVNGLRSPPLPHESCLVLAVALNIYNTTDSLLASVTLTKQQQFHTVCKFSLALAQYIILTKNYLTNERNLKAKFTVCALSFVLFSLSSRLGAKTT